MCLFTKQICPLRARKDIVCYKRFELVRLPNSFFSLMTTPVRGTMVRVPTDEPTVMIAYPDSIEKIRIENATNPRSQIYGGMIHAYTKIEYSESPWHLAIFKCIIPKGTLYYKGTSGDICAKKMLVVEQVK